MTVERVVIGNAADDGACYRSWFVGHFIRPSSDPRATEALEIKWSIHPAGEQRNGWGVGHQTTWLSVLIRGRFIIVLPDREVLLAAEGDYVLVPSGIPHTARADEDSVVLTIRWPSLAGDAVTFAALHAAMDEHQR